MDTNPPKKGAPESAYSKMLLRQNPWLEGVLQEDELPMALSFRTSEWLFGSSFIFIGGFMFLDVLLHPTSFGSIPLALLLGLLGATLAYSGLWAILFAKRSYVLVTSRRIVYQKISFLGKPGKQISIPHSDIQRIRFLKSTVMYRIRRSDGGIAILLKNGKTVLISSLRNAENILGAVR